MRKLGYFNGKDCSLVVLEEQMARKLGLKAYSCTCGCSFVTAFYAMFHLQKQHPGEPFQDRMHLDVAGMKTQEEWTQLYTAVSEIIFQSIGQTYDDEIPATNTNGNSPPISPVDFYNQSIAVLKNEPVACQSAVDLKRAAEDSTLNDEMINKRRKVAGLGVENASAMEEDDLPPGRFEERHKFTADEVFQKQVPKTTSIAFKIPIKKKIETEIVNELPVEKDEPAARIESTVEETSDETPQASVIDEKIPVPNISAELFSELTSETAEPEPTVFKKKKKKNLHLYARKTKSTEDSEDQQPITPNEPEVDSQTDFTSNVAADIIKELEKRELTSDETTLEESEETTTYCLAAFKVIEYSPKADKSDPSNEVVSETSAANVEKPPADNKNCKEMMVKPLPELRPISRRQANLDARNRKLKQTLAPLQLQNIPQASTSEPNQKLNLETQWVRPPSNHSQAPVGIIPNIRFINSLGYQIPDPKFYPYPNFGLIENPANLVDMHGSPSPMMIYYCSEFYDYVLRTRMPPEAAGQHWINWKLSMPHQPMNITTTWR